MVDSYSTLYISVSSNEEIVSATILRRLGLVRHIGLDTFARFHLFNEPV